MKQYLRLLQEQSFAGLFLGQIISRFGDGMAAVVVTWTVWERTDSATMVAISMIAQTLPHILFSFAAGIVADRYNHRAVMIATDVVRMAVTCAVALISIAGALAPWHLMLMNFVLAAAGGFFGAARAAAVPRLVAPDQLQAANGLMTGSFQAAILIGPLLGGWLLSVASAGTLLLVNAATFAISILGLLVLPPTFSSAGSERLSMGAGIRRGFAAVRAVPSLAWVIGTFGIGTFLVGGVFEVGKTILVDRLGAGPAGLGLLSTAMGVGLMAGSFWVGRSAAPYKARLVFGAWLIDGLLFALYGLSSHLWMAVGISFLSGVGTAYINVPSGALIQQHGGSSVGQVFSYWTISIWLGQSLSLALAAPLFERLPFAAVFGVSGLLLSLLSALGLRMVWSIRESESPSEHRAS